MHGDKGYTYWDFESNGNSFKALLDTPNRINEGGVLGGCGDKITIMFRIPSKTDLPSGMPGSLSCGVQAFNAYADNGETSLRVHIALLWPRVSEAAPPSKAIRVFY